MYYIFLYRSMNNCDYSTIYIKTMTYMEDLKMETEKLDRIITVRMTNEDYMLLKSVSQNSGTNVSITIRYLITMVNAILKNYHKRK